MGDQQGDRDKRELLCSSFPLSSPCPGGAGSVLAGLCPSACVAERGSAPGAATAVWFHPDLSPLLQAAVWFLCVSCFHSVKGLCRKGRNSLHLFWTPGFRRVPLPFPGLKDAQNQARGIPPPTPALLPSPSMAKQSNEPPESDPTEIFIRFPQVRLNQQPNVVGILLPALMGSRSGLEIWQRFLLH